MTDITSVDPAEKPLRRDAERNRRRILDAARELFAQRGLGVTLNDIAHHAGVGVGTVYRRFPDKSVLIEGLFEESFEEIVARMQTALADPDPWHGIVRFLEGQFEAQANDRGLKELITEAPGGLERIARLRGRLLPMSERLVQRARRAGVVRPDIQPSDFAITQLMIGAVLDVSHDVDPELWRRYLALLLRGMSARPEELGPLAEPALGPEQVDTVMSRAKTVRR